MLRESTLVHPFAVGSVVERLRAAGGGYEVVHESPGLELGVYVLVAPEPDRQQPHADDEVYVVLDGTGALEVEGSAVDVKVGDPCSSRREPSTGSAPTSSSRRS